MRQLPLDLALEEFARFETFSAGSNGAVVAAVQQAATDPRPAMHYIWGAPGSGRSHLLQAAVAEAPADQRCAWLPLDGSAALAPEMLDGMGQLNLVCLDAVDAVAGHAGWERALFNLCEARKAHGGRLLATASAAPGAAGFALPDLASRMAAGATWRLQPLDDDELLQALQLRARWRGLELGTDAGRYLLRRMPRAPAQLFASLDKFDAAALAAARGRLTIPLIKTVLERAAD